MLSPICGWSRAVPGWMIERFPANPSSESAAATWNASVRSATSFRTSAPRPSETPFAPISASASFAASSIGSSPTPASASPPRSIWPSTSARPIPISTLPMSDISERSPWPTEPI